MMPSLIEIHSVSLPKPPGSKSKSTVLRDGADEVLPEEVSLENSKIVSEKVTLSG